MWNAKTLPTASRVALTSMMIESSPSGDRPRSSGASRTISLGPGSTNAIRNE
jgi:hypothetical protein